MIAARKTINRVACLLLGLALAAGPGAEAQGLLSGYSFQAESMEQWRLPDRLKEISGLALDASERLFAVADERAVIYELDAEQGRLIKAFALGDPVVRGDFEGIAILGSRFFLVTSDGEIFESREGDDGEQLAYERWPTGLGRRCEVEGLATDEPGRRLLLLCKQLRPGGIPGNLGIHAWSAETRVLVPEAAIDLPLAEILAAIRMDRFNPSGISRDLSSGHLLLVAARQRALAELRPDGGFVGALRLPLEQRHRQPEGIERLQDGRLLIADEGGSRKARLAIYRRDRDRSNTNE